MNKPGNKSKERKGLELDRIEAALGGSLMELDLRAALVKLPLLELYKLAGYVTEATRRGRKAAKAPRAEIGHGEATHGEATAPTEE